MDICNSYTIQTIYLDECIGTSLLTINNNYTNLKEQACTDSTNLSAVETEFLTLSSDITTLSALRTGFAKAWVSFNGNLGNVGTGEREIYSKYNVSTVIRQSQGVYLINFSPTFSNANYALVGTSQQTSTPSWVQTTMFNTMSAGISIRGITGTLQDPDYVSILVYNN